MEQNILIAGVGGQGILSVAFCICDCAMREGLQFKQSEVHGMAQRGGAVQSNIRLSDRPVESDLIPKGRCHLLLSVEPLEAARYREYLGPESVVVTSTNPFANIPDYPKEDAVFAALEMVRQVIPVDAASLARQAGSALAQGMAVLGAASHDLALRTENLEESVRAAWKAKGDKVVETNLSAFRLGRRMAGFLRAAAEAGADKAHLRAFAAELDVDKADPSKAGRFTAMLRETPKERWAEALSGSGVS